jgi:hypothetical protein
MSLEGFLSVSSTITLSFNGVGFFDFAINLYEWSRVEVNVFRCFKVYNFMPHGKANGDTGKPPAPFLIYISM